MNFMISIAGWFLWNLIAYEIEHRKRAFDKDPNTNYTFAEHKKKYKITWLGSLVCVPILLWAASRQLSLDPFASIIAPGMSLGWNDVLLLGAGAAYEMLIFVVKLVTSYFAKKSSGL